MPAHTDDVTFVLTSYKRFDLLEETLRSFLATNNYPLKRMIVIEDSDDTGVLEVTRKFPEANIEVVFNKPNLGLLGSLDKVYAMVDTEFVFHSEDDWRFSEKNVIADSLTLMKNDPKIALVWPRSGDGGPRWIKRLGYTSFQGVEYRPIDPQAHHVWGNFTFNPGLRRLSHYKMLDGGFQKFGEGGTSIAFKRMGLRMVILKHGGVGHIGAQATTAGPKRRFHKLRRLPRSIRLRTAHTLWRLRLKLGLGA